MFVLALVAGVLVLFPPGLDVAGLGGSSGGGRRAVIVDQLSLTAPNPDFVRDTRALLEANGYTVDYAGGEQITVDFYRNLPKGNYGLVILRVHSTAEVTRGSEDVTAVSLFTGQPYTRELYYQEQLQGRVGFAQYTEDGPKFFGITSEFVQKSMNGDFNGATVLMMGCQGFINNRGAEAFADKGARTFIGWDGLVSAQHTDAATEALVRQIVQNGADPKKAIELTMADVGPDPTYGSHLISRP